MSIKFMSIIRFISVHCKCIVKKVNSIAQVYGISIFLRKISFLFVFMVKKVFSPFLVSFDYMSRDFLFTKVS